MGRPKKDRLKAPRATMPGGVVQRLQIGGTVYVQQYVRCGKACEVCMRGGREFEPDRPGHGPYWYATWTKEGRMHRRYVGVALSVRGVDADEARRDEAASREEGR